MPAVTASSMLCIIDDLINNLNNREEADLSLKKLSLVEHEHKFARALGGLFLKLMRVPTDEDAIETELCSRFFDPFLTGLLLIKEFVCGGQIIQLWKPGHVRTLLQCYGKRMERNSEFLIDISVGFRALALPMLRLVVIQT